MPVFPYLAHTAIEATPAITKQAPPQRWQKASARRLVVARREDPRRTPDIRQSEIEPIGNDDTDADKEHLG